MRTTIDQSVTPISAGVTIELCAGLVDKDCSLAETARQEVLEECGYDVPVEQFEVIVAARYVVRTYALVYQ